MKETIDLSFSQSTVVAKMKIYIFRLAVSGHPNLMLRQHPEIYISAVDLHTNLWQVNRTPHQKVL